MTDYQYNHISLETRDYPEMRSASVLEAGNPISKSIR
jgi:hypothetical protein